MAIINYIPPPTIKAFIKSYQTQELFFSWIVGPVGCVAPETRVVTERGLVPIADLTRPTRVLSWNAKTCRYQLSWCGGSFQKGMDYLYRVTTQLGEFDAAGHHQLLCADGAYRRVCDLQVGQIVQICSSSQTERDVGYDQPVSREGGQHWTQTISDWFVHCAASVRRGGLRLLRDEGSGRELVPSHSDARTSALFLGSFFGGHEGGQRGQSQGRSHQGRHDVLRQIDGSKNPIHHLLSGEGDRVSTAVSVRAGGSGLRDERFRQTSADRCTKGQSSINGQALGYSTSYRPILSIQRRDVKQEFWDMQVGDTNNYVTEDGCIHHNSGKTTGLFFKLVYMAKLQAKSPDGIRRSRAVIIRNTMPQLKDTTLVSFGYWFKDGQAGHWNATDKIFTLRYDDVECIILFRPLDTPDDINRVLSLDVNFAILDEFVEIPKAIIDALSARVGRYKQPDGTPVTVYGIWGSSNPSTEDNWWYDYLHGPDVRWHGEDEHGWRARHMILNGTLPPNAIYFYQPSGLSPGAENLENLPPYDGSNKYYTDIVKGRTLSWVKQYVDAEWGYSSVGQAVVASFRPDWHVARSPLVFNPNLPLIVGTDPGITGSALVLMQEDYSGRVNVLKEIIQRGYGAKRIIAERLLPVLKIEYPEVDLSRVIIALDPAGASRTQTDESTCRKVFQDFGFTVDCETNNRFPLRLAAYEHYTTTTAEGEYALQVDPHKCPVFTRAMKGGWRYGADIKKDILKGAEPEKNEYSHPGDAGGYGLRYFHRGLLRFEKYGVRGRVAIPGTGRYAPVPPVTPWGVQPPSLQAQRAVLNAPPKYHFK